MFDTTLILHAFRAERLDVTLDIAGEHNTHLVPASVVREIEVHGGVVPPWLEQITEDLDAVVAAASWQRVLGAERGGRHHAGEASTLAVVQARPGAIAVIDDGDARRVGQRYGIEVHGSLWVAAQAVNENRWDSVSVAAWCDALLTTGIRWPFKLGGFLQWAEGEGLIGRGRGDS